MSSPAKHCAVCQEYYYPNRQRPHRHDVGECGMCGKRKRLYRRDWCRQCWVLEQDERDGA